MFHNNSWCAIMNIYENKSKKNKSQLVSAKSSQTESTEALYE